MFYLRFVIRRPNILEDRSGKTNTFSNINMDFSTKNRHFPCFLKFFTIKLQPQTENNASNSDQTTELTLNLNEYTN